MKKTESLEITFNRAYKEDLRSINDESKKFIKSYKVKDNWQNEFCKHIRGQLYGDYNWISGALIDGIIDKYIHTDIKDTVGYAVIELTKYFEEIGKENARYDAKLLDPHYIAEFIAKYIAKHNYLIEKNYKIEFNPGFVEKKQIPFSKFEHKIYVSRKLARETIELNETDKNIYWNHPDKVEFYKLCSALHMSNLVNTNLLESEFAIKLAEVFNVDIKSIQTYSSKLNDSYSNQNELHKHFKIFDDLRKSAEQKRNQYLKTKKGRKAKGTS